MIKIENNYFNAGWPQNQDMSEPKPHLTLKDNPRPKCALIIGDGFTQGYLRFNKANLEIPCTIHDLIPAPKKVKYMPTQGDRFVDEVFFSKEKWPRIFELYDKGLSGLDFFEKVSKEMINPEYQNNLWSVNNTTIGYEIRCYLWHYFRSINQKTYNIEKNLRYEWYSILKGLLESFFLQVISFNYDTVIIQMILDTKYLYRPTSFNIDLFGKFRCPVEMSYDYYMNYYDINTIPVIYIHGSWINQILFPFPIKFNKEYQTTDKDFEYINEKITWQPEDKDYIEGGFQGIDKYNPYSEATNTSRSILKNAELVIICGLSGRAPDTEEVKDLLESINGEARIVHIGLESDRSNPVANILTTFTELKYQFFDANTELGELNSYIKDTFNI